MYILYVTFYITLCRNFSYIEMEVHIYVKCTLVRGGYDATFAVKYMIHVEH